MNILAYDVTLLYSLHTEDSAYQLYKAAAEATEDPQLKKTLQLFAEVEPGHKKRVEDLYERTSSPRTKNAHPYRDHRNTKGGAASRQQR